MRSELIFGTVAYVSNRYLLARLASKATRKLHRPNTRIQDTANEAFARLGRTRLIAGVPCTGNLLPFPRAAQTETASHFANLKRSVA
jgi:hypothetical protein